ncbi:S10 family peptidase [Roseiterribacter gracilis]|uniref:Peptidase S10 n=1 Tax=Roseiterribacter gracilis TaxID=2812848 RepID=A0A8S8XDY8_9PROT|nr:peptidase S10 [Rhodospirillales bacterium TMPK1]
MRALLPTILLLLLLSGPAGAAADEAPRQFTAKREGTFGGQKLRYQVISGDTILADDKGQPRAAIFSFAYIKDAPKTEQTTRPVLFVYNGGPGSASLWLHLGTFGPRRVKMADPVHPPTTPPFALEDNPFSILDAADIVLIDPVGTGFSRILSAGKPEQFYGTEQDAKATVEFIESWTRANNRWNAPKYLVGESYGTVRSAVVAKMLMGGPMSGNARLGAITLNGIVLLGQALTLGSDGEATYATNLASMAATAWYHNKIDRKGRSADEVASEAARFAGDAYLKALFAGDRLDAAERARVADTMAALIGIPAAEILNRNLRIEMGEFRSLLLKTESQEIGAYDSRYVYKGKPAGAADAVADDPAMGQYTPSFIAGINQYLRDELGININASYETIAFGAVNEKWAYTTPTSGRVQIATPVQSLAAAMRRNEKLRLFVGTGLYDLVTTVGKADYMIAHAGLPLDRVTAKTYPSGHMAYLGDDSAAKLASDLRSFINESK